MERREALKISAGTVGWCLAMGTFSSVISSCKTDVATGWKPAILTQDQMDFVEELCEMIIPKTDTPGAKDALVHRYVDEAVANYFTAKERAIFLNGVMQIDNLAKEKDGKVFAETSMENRTAIMDALFADAEATKGSGNGDPHMIIAFRDFVKHAFFTSEVGATQVLKYDPVPTRYDGCIPLSDVGAIWS